MDLDSVADRLYGLPPEEFVAARNACDKEARGGGERELAASIHGLGKPTMVAWLANQLVRERADQIGSLLELGTQLREASASLSGEDLRRLSQQQRQVLNALVQQANGIARAAGHRVSEENARGLEGTLRAALADSELADQLASGRLTDALEHVGFSPADAGSAPTRPTTRQTRPKAVQRDVDAAQSAADAADAGRDETRVRLDKAATAAAELADQVRRLREELARAVDERGRADREQRAARAAHDKADRAARDAQRRLEDQTARRDRLTE